MRTTIDIRLLARGGTTGIPGYTRDLLDALFSQPATDQYTLFYSGLRRQPLPTHWLIHPRVQLCEKTIPNRLLDLSFRLLHAPHIERLAPADLIFSPHFNLLPPSQTPRVITIHDLSFLHYPQFFSPEQQLWHKLQHYAEQIRRAEHIIAVSEFTKSDLINLLDIPAERISVIYSGINPSFRPLESNDLRLVNFKIKRELHQPFVLYLGSLEPRKNIPLLVRAFTQFKQHPAAKDYQLVLAGRPGYQASSLQRAIAASAARDDIRLLGDVTDAERVLLYNAARVFVFPSWFEGFGFPPLEAQACGTPVIASNRTSLPEILSTAALYIDPWRSDALTEALLAIEMNSKVRENNKMAGLANSARFSWQTTAEQTAAVFHRLTH